MSTDNSQKMYVLAGANGDKTGLGIALKVMGGDNVNILGKSFWLEGILAKDNTMTPYSVQVIKL